MLSNHADIKNDIDEPLWSSDVQAHKQLVVSVHTAKTQGGIYARTQPMRDAVTK